MARNNSENIVLAGLLTHATVAKTATATGISESTIFKYLRDPAFKERYEAAKLEQLEQSTATLQANITKAVNAIVAVIESPQSSQQVKLNAADMLLRNSFRFTEQVEVLKRLDKLEKAQFTDGGHA